MASMTGVIADDLASYQSCHFEDFFPKAAKVVRYILSHTASYFPVAESTGYKAPKSF